MSVTIAGVEFDHVVYDAPVDVLYLHVGKPAIGSAVDWDESAEGDGLRYGPDGRLVGITILNARRRIEREGRLIITLPERQIEAPNLDDILVTA